MMYYSPVRNRDFVGRESYWRRLKEIDALDAAAIIVVYGRRRIGKTELIEQYFRGRPLLKFEGLQPDRPGVRRGSPVERNRQLAGCVKRLGIYLRKPPEYADQVMATIYTWSDFYRLLEPLLAGKPIVLYLDEVQWLANHGNELLGELKPLWDDALRHNHRLRIVLTSSSPSFIQQLEGLSALCSRSSHTMKLEPLDLQETAQLLGKGAREAMLAAMAVGGVPEYLKQVRGGAPVYANLYEKSFRPGGFFRAEKDRVFAGAFSTHRRYEAIIEHLARRGPSSREELQEALRRKEDGTAGGSFSPVLDELVALDFVERLLPVTRARKIRNPSRSHQARYVVADEYLRFYYNFIAPREPDIDIGLYDKRPVRAINRQEFSQAMGLSFGSWCRRNARLIARHLRFDEIVEYAHGPWYEALSAQIDLMFIRRDVKIIICEIKYNCDTTLRREVIMETQEKMDVFIERNPSYARHTFETALITIQPVSDALKNEGYFTYFITSDDLLATAARGH